MDIERIREGWRQGVVTDREILDALTTVVDQMTLVLVQAEYELREVVTAIQSRRAVE